MKSSVEPVWVIVPVKAFAEAKARLSEALLAPQRAQLARDMATHVVSAAAPLPVAVVCDDDGVAEWATEQGATVIWCPGTDLNGAVQQGFAELRSRGVEHVIVSHGDLPFASGFDQLSPWPGVTLVPDRHGTGTNVLAVPTALDFRFSYGEGSFRRHVVEACRFRQGIRIVHEASLGWDIDLPDDLDPLDSTFGQSTT